METVGMQVWLRGRMTKRDSNEFRSHGGNLNWRFENRTQNDRNDHEFDNRGSRNEMAPVNFLYVPILLKETFIKALWGTGAEKPFISKEIYYKYFSYKPRTKSNAEVVIAQGARCTNLGMVELQMRIRKFTKTWNFHILAEMQYQCILGIDFMMGTKITLDFNKKLLVILDSQNKKLPIIDEHVEIDLSNTKLGNHQKELKTLYNSFRGLFSDKPGLTCVFYHKIDTGDKPPVVLRPQRYDRIKQKIINYHVNKMLDKGTIIPIQSPYASPMVLCSKKNGLSPDSPEAY
ncbi:uncharacterized protein TNCV_1519981 [Trichonephila clavipes]|nr:uncharacterized protein TNCV_1519981 [Trichonephila clavipes]